MFLKCFNFELKPLYDIGEIRFLTLELISEVGKAITFRQEYSLC